MLQCVDWYLPNLQHISCVTKTPLIRTFQSEVTNHKSSGSLMCYGAWIDIYPIVKISAAAQKLSADRRWKITGQTEYIYICRLWVSDSILAFSWIHTHRTLKIILAGVDLNLQQECVISRLGLDLTPPPPPWWQQYEWHMHSVSNAWGNSLPPGHMIDACVKGTVKWAPSMVYVLLLHEVTLDKLTDTDWLTDWLTTDRQLDIYFPCIKTLPTPTYKVHPRSSMQSSFQRDNNQHGGMKVCLCVKRRFSTPPQHKLPAIIWCRRLPPEGLAYHAPCVAGPNQCSQLCFQCSQCKVLASRKGWTTSMNGNCGWYEFIFWNILIKWNSH